MYDIINQHNPRSVLVVWGLKGVLMRPGESALHPINMRSHKRALDGLMTALTPEQASLALTLAEQNKQLALIEPEILDVVQTLKQRNIRTCALTSTLTGEIDGNLFEAWYYKSLLDLGISFSDQFIQKEILFKDIPPRNNYHPSLHHGIISTNSTKRQDKGTVMLSFLKHIEQQENFKPTMVIYIEDRSANIDHVCSTIRINRKDITFVGMQYTAGHKQFSHLSEKEFLNTWRKFTEKAVKILV